MIGAVLWRIAPRYHERVLTSALVGRYTKGLEETHAKKYCWTSHSEAVHATDEGHISANALREPISQRRNESSNAPVEETLHAPATKFEPAQNVILAAICNCRGVLAMFVTTPAELSPIVVPGVPRI